MNFMSFKGKNRWQTTDLWMSTNVTRQVSGIPFGEITSRMTSNINVHRLHRKNIFSNMSSRETETSVGEQLIKNYFKNWAFISNHLFCSSPFFFLSIFYSTQLRLIRCGIFFLPKVFLSWNQGWKTPVSEGTVEESNKTLPETSSHCGLLVQTITSSLIQHSQIFFKDKAFITTGLYNSHRIP